MRRPAPAAVLAAGAFAAGAIGIVSALTPEIASRSDLVDGVLPPGVPEVARVLSLAFGLALIRLARGLRRRSRRAWALAVAVVVASAAAHLAKGLDFEEAAATLVLLAALVRWRRVFVVPGDPQTVAPLLGEGVALVALGAAAWLLALSDAFADALGVLALAVGAHALYLWLRPLAERRRQSQDERVRAEAIVRAHGADTLAFFKLRQDASWFFSPSGSAFLGYRVCGGTAVVAGDPVGAADELEPLLASFRAYAHAHGWRTAALGVSAGAVPAFRALGFKSAYLGDEAIVKPCEFNLEGRRIRKVRQSVARLERLGYRVRVVDAEAVDGATRAELERVSRAWLCGACERGFAMAHDMLFVPGATIAYAEDAAHRVGGFVQLVPAPASGGWSLSASRRDPGAPNGVMEFVIVRTLRWMQERGSPELSLNFAVLGDVLRSRDAGWKAPVRAVLVRLDRFFQLRRLEAFSAKFGPEWRPRHLCFESWTQLPEAVLACLRVERLLTPPWRSA
jgi:lysyl-tRNA synthetase class 2